MKVEELKGNTGEELNEKLVQLRKELFSLRMKKSTGQLRTTHELKLVKRNIARVLTLIAQKNGSTVSVQGE